MSNNKSGGYEWRVEDGDRDIVDRLVKVAGISPIVARILVNRNIKTPEEATSFFESKLAHLHDPSLLPDLDKGVDTLASAMEREERICVYGDYDVDGVTSTALLVRTLRALNANVSYKLPHRKKDGYGIKPVAIENAAKQGVSVVLTCDCGIQAFDAAEYANNKGISLIITDHHEPGDRLPSANAVINPKRDDALYPFKELAGVGVAFKFAQGLVRKLGHNEDSFISRFVDLAALGTVADVVPLLGENRTIVKHGLERIPLSKKMGFQTMLKTTNLIGKPLTAYYLAYVLGPRINSVGRMDDASAALELFLTGDHNEALMLTEEMERCNTLRKAEQEKILAEAIEQVESKDLSQTRVLVLSKEGWNAGIVGIVAGRICEMYNRPTILLSRDEAAGIGGGSARSIETFNMLEGLRHCSDLLGRFGGHSLAAGLSLPLSNIGSFEEKINIFACDTMSEEDISPYIAVDAELNPGEITRGLVDKMEQMEPFGMGNPEPLFITRNMAVLQRQRVGDGSHLRMRLQGEGCAPIGCIAFGLGDIADHITVGQTIDICYNVRLNVFNGIETVQLIGKDIRL